MIEQLNKAPLWFVSFVASGMFSVIGVLLALVLYGLKREIKRIDTSFAGMSKKLDSYTSIFSEAVQEVKTRVTIVEEHCSPQHETRISVLENELKKHKDP